jgi:cytochrome c oxidase subunit 2
VNRTVTLRINASDVVHSWWIPDLGGKADAVPGHTNETWFKATKLGRYHGQCAELCGEGHADMQADVEVVSEEAYTAWLDGHRQAILDAQAALAKQRKERDAATAEK